MLLLYTPPTLLEGDSAGRKFFISQNINLSLHYGDHRNNKK
jgi:hypothetical protein